MPNAFDTYRGDLSRVPSRATWVAYRVLVGLALLALATGAVVVFLVIAGAVQVADVTAWGGSVRLSLEHLAAVTGVDRVIAAAAAVSVALAALALLLRGGRAAPTPSLMERHILTVDDNGFVLIENASVQAVAELAALSAPGVVEALVRVRGKAAGPVQLFAKVEVLPGSDVRRAGDEVRERIRATIEDMVGLTVREASVQVRVMDADTLVQVA